MNNRIVLISLLMLLLSGTRMAMPCAPTNTPTNTPTETPTITPQTTPASVLWQSDRLPVTNGDDDVDNYVQEPKVFWPRHVGDHHGWIIRRAQREETLEFAVITPVPVCVDSNGVEQTPTPWENINGKYWCFPISPLNSEARYYYEINSLSSPGSLYLNRTYDLNASPSMVSKGIRMNLHTDGPEIKNYNALTIEVVFKPMEDYESNYNNQTIAAICGSSSSQGNFSLGDTLIVNLRRINPIGSANHYLQGIIQTSNDSYATSTNQLNLPTGEWRHVALVWTGAKMTIYVDGINKGSIATSGELSGGNPDTGYYALVVGSWYWYQHMKGQYDSLCISNVAREASDFVLRGPRVIDTNVTLLWTFDEAQGDTLIDHSSNDYDGTIWVGPEYQFSDMNEWLTGEGVGHTVGSVCDLPEGNPYPTWQGGYHHATATSVPTATATPWSVVEHENELNYLKFVGDEDSDGRETDIHPK